MYVCRRCRYNLLPDNFDRDNLYHGSTPRPSRSTKTLEDTQTIEKNDVGLLPPPAAPLPDRQTLLRPRKFTKLKERCRRGHPEPLEALLRPPQTLEALPRRPQTLEKRRGQATNMIHYCA